MIMLKTKADISDINGAHLGGDDIYLPKELSKDMLIKYPIIQEQVRQFFEDHTKAKGVVIRRTDKDKLD